MPTAFSRPALPDLINQSIGYAQARLPQLTPPLRRNLYSTLLTVQAMLASTGYGYLDWIVVNALIPATATGDYLDRWANFFGVTRNPAEASAGSVTFTGAIDGTVIPAGTVVQTSDSVTSYATTAPATLLLGTATAPALATLPGIDTLQSAGTVLNLVVAIAGLDGTATVAAGGLVGGIDAELDLALRTRLVARLTTPPQGGAASDYIAWVKSLYPAASRAWCYPLDRGAGTVDVTFVCDERATTGSDAAILPTSADLAAVDGALATVRPVTADVAAFALAPAYQIVQIGNLVPNTAAVQAAIAVSLAAFYLTTTPGVGPNLTIFGDGIVDGIPPGLVQIEAVSAAIRAVDGVVRFTLLSPLADYTAPGGVIALFGGVTFV